MYLRIIGRYILDDSGSIVATLYLQITSSGAKTNMRFPVTLLHPAISPASLIVSASTSITQKKAQMELAL